MGTKKNFIREYKWVIIALVAGPIIVNILAVIPAIPKLTAGDAYTWIGFFGNYSGGIIGGIVALLVTKYQINHQINEEHKRRLRQQLPTLHALKFELEKIKKIMDNYSFGFNSFRELQEDTIKSQHQIPDWDRELFSNLNLIVDESLLVDLLYFREEYAKIWLSLRGDLIGLKVELEKLEKKYAETLYDQRITQKKAELGVLIAEMEDNKKYAWEQISKGLIAEKIDVLIEKLHAEIRRSR